MKKIVFGSFLCLSAVILFGLNLIAVSIYSGYGYIKTKEYGEEIVGAFPLVFSVILFILGIVISIYGFKDEK